MLSPVDDRHDVARVDVDDEQLPVGARHLRDELGRPLRAVRVGHSPDAAEAAAADVLADEPVLAQM
jgi:hypothetical protein